ncbi:hypothetical protein RUM43_000996 [Polyplax serrata]|uniref:Uncharacterized protein n=1 Tax=Polyplax serrata TaxID=468196 RepID=A0AAN8XT52_POLSC
MIDIQISIRGKTMLLIANQPILTLTTMEEVRQPMQLPKAVMMTEVTAVEAVVLTTQIKCMAPIRRVMDQNLSMVSTRDIKPNVPGSNKKVTFRGDALLRA